MSTLKDVVTILTYIYIYIYIYICVRCSSRDVIGLESLESTKHEDHPSVSHSSHIPSEAELKQPPQDPPDKELTTFSSPQMTGGEVESLLLQCVDPMEDDVPMSSSTPKDTSIKATAVKGKKGKARAKVQPTPMKRRRKNLPPSKLILSEVEVSGDESMGEDASDEEKDISGLIDDDPIQEDVNIHRQLDNQRRKASETGRKRAIESEEEPGEEERPTWKKQRKVFSHFQDEEEDPDIPIRMDQEEEDSDIDEEDIPDYIPKEWEWADEVPYERTDMFSKVYAEREDRECIPTVYHATTHKALTISQLEVFHLPQSTNAIRVIDISEMRANVEVRSIDPRQLLREVMESCESMGDIQKADVIKYEMNKIKEDLKGSCPTNHMEVAAYLVGLAVDAIYLHRTIAKRKGEPIWYIYIYIYIKS